MTIALRALEESDAAAYHALTTHPQVARTLGSVSTERVDVYAERLASLSADHATLLGAFVDGELAGVAQLTGYARPRVRHSARLWVAVHPRCWGQGVGSALVAALLHVADRWWGFVRVELDVTAANTAAVRLYEKHGFVVEARKRGDYRLDGVFADGFRMARVRHDWQPPPALDTALPEPPPRRAPADVRLRAPTRDDASALARLHEELSVVDATMQVPYQTTRGWAARLTGPPARGVHSLVAEVEGEVAGLIALMRPESPRVEHQAHLGMSVALAHQGRGVGGALMRAILSVADEAFGLERVELEVLPDNLRARTLYERHGFVEEGVLRSRAIRRGGYTDSVLMARMRPRAS